MESDDPGFDHSVLPEFRNRVAEGHRADWLLAVFGERLVAAELAGVSGSPRTATPPPPDSGTHST
ncbi:hypothetical protein [Embleya scabrispora]|uniref:hypothetical protein n=1 Tax=Embleya scabrispora TaxID=159449 RepID=UPI0039C8BC78